MRWGIFLSVLCGSSFVWSSPSGIQPIQGEVTCTQESGHTKIIASHNSIIQYQSFDIQKEEIVEFVQPSSTSRVFNKILSPFPSQIDGAIQANGIVYLVNPSGILFGKDSIIDVGGFFAAAAHLQDQDFLLEKDRFSAPAGSVIIDGKIFSNSFLRALGKTVVQNGKLLATDDIGIFTSNKEVIIGNPQGHTFVAFSASMQEKEEPTLAKDVYALALHHTGESKAKSISMQTDQGCEKIEVTLSTQGDKEGEIFLCARNLTLSSAQILASGCEGGGQVYIGGFDQGLGNLPKAENTIIDAQSLIQVNAIEKGNGGKVIVWSEDTTSFYGTIEAKGGLLSGDGGFVEVSGKKHLDFQGNTNRFAPFGQWGTLLLDPYSNITIQETETTKGSFSSGTYTPGQDGDILNYADINSQLASGNVIIQTSRGDGAQDGDIILNINGQSLGNASQESHLTLHAQKDIRVSSLFRWEGRGTLLLEGENKAILSEAMTLTIPNGSIEVKASSIELGMNIQATRSVFFNGPVVLVGNSHITSTTQGIYFGNSVTGSLYNLSVSSPESIIFLENIDICALSSIENTSCIPDHITFNKAVTLGGNLVGYSSENKETRFSFIGEGNVQIAGTVTGRNLAFRDNEYSISLGSGKVYNDAENPLTIFNHGALVIGTIPHTCFEALHDVHIHGPTSIKIYGPFISGGHVIVD